MKRFLLLSLVALVAIVASAQDCGERKVKVYCKLQCVGYNLLKDDLNVRVDFGLAEKAENAYGWIYNSETNKRRSFSSVISVLNYFGARGWHFSEELRRVNRVNKDVIDVFYILEKEVPVGFTEKDILEDMDYRLK